SDATRRDILTRLARRESTVSTIAAPYDMSFNAVSKHVMVLENAGLVKRRIEGRVHHLSLNAKPLRRAGEWLHRYQAFWSERLDALEEFLERKKGAQHGAGSPHDQKTRRHGRGRVRRMDGSR
ncbi:MAG: ArsR/SmtB family transcription factor, partial [Gemmatimonadaceae bacterium]